MIAALVLVAAVAIGLFATRHRVTRASLPHSLADAAGSDLVPEFPVACRGGAVGAWRCQIRNRSAGSRFAVVVDGHCWRAVELGPRPPDTRRRALRGCVGLGDQLRLGDRLSPFA